MKTRRLGTSAIAVSDICMGTMTFGSQADEKMSLRILDQAFEFGIDFYDTAENYPVPPDPKWAGRTEEIVGKWLKTKDRDSVIVASGIYPENLTLARAVKLHIEHRVFINGRKTVILR